MKIMFFCDKNEVILHNKIRKHENGFRLSTSPFQAFIFLVSLTFSGQRLVTSLVFSQLLIIYNRL